MSAVNRLRIEAAEAMAVELAERGEDWAALTICGLLATIEHLDPDRIRP